MIQSSLDSGQIPDKISDDDWGNVLALPPNVHFHGYSEGPVGVDFGLYDFLALPVLLG